jgi:hypothetical protein
MWRGGSRSGLSVAAPFVWRCGAGSYVAPSPSLLGQRRVEHHINSRLQRAQELHQVGVGDPSLLWRALVRHVALRERERLAFEVDLGVDVCRSLVGGGRGATTRPSPDIRFFSLVAAKQPVAESAESTLPAAA